MRTDCVYKGALSGLVEETYLSPLTRKRIEGLYIYADGSIELKVIRNYETLFNLNDTITPQQIITAREKHHSFVYPARGNKFDFQISPGQINPATKVSVYVLMDKVKSKKIKR